ncbi:hypothetical protein [Atlantibacter hermannii]|uniref:hypothetical protein n=1 Tax=Atlantibacter hermannii TaxID=565 RepID=UPI0028A64C68|nr:hypothetical protein [Atlantibacter hermannii]
MMMDIVVKLEIYTPSHEQVEDVARNLERELSGNALNAANALWFSEELKRRVMELVQINIQYEK